MMKNYKKKIIREKKGEDREKEIGNKKGKTCTTINVKVEREIEEKK